MLSDFRFLEFDHIRGTYLTLSTEILSKLKSSCESQELCELEILETVSKVTRKM